MLFSECDDRWQVQEELKTVLHWVRQPGPPGGLLEVTKVTMTGSYDNPAVLTMLMSSATA